MGKSSYRLNGKAIYSPKGAAAEYAAVGCNLYTGCPHDCQYCYLKRGVLAHAMGSADVRLKSCFKDFEDAEMTFVREMDKHLDYLKQVGIFFSFSTDPLIKETRELTKCCLIQANKRGVPVKMLTKNADFIDDDVFMSWLKLPEFRKEIVAFGFTLTGRDDMETNASTNSQRIDTMKRLCNMGFKTFASIEPIVDFKSSLQMVEHAAKYCDLFKIGLRSGVKKDYYDPAECAYFIGKVTGLCEKTGFKVYWKKSVREFVMERSEDRSFISALSVSDNFVNADYNLFV